VSFHGSSKSGSRCDGRGWISVAGSASKQWNKFSVSIIFNATSLLHTLIAETFFLLINCSMLTASDGESASSDVDAPNFRESRREAMTWSFRVRVRLEDGQTFSDLLDLRQQQLETSLASASVISWACVPPLVSQDLNGMYLDGFVHASTLIRLGSLKRWLPEKLVTHAGEIMDAAFEEVKPGPGNNYMSHPTIKAFLEETSLDPLASDKRMRVDYRGSSASASNLEIILGKTWFGRGTMRCSDRAQVEAIFSSENVAHRQEATLKSTFACA
jgi:hypothetical protein